MRTLSYDRYELDGGDDPWLEQQFLTITHGRKQYRVHIGAGNCDDVTVFRHGELFVVYTEQPRLDYAGVSVFILGRGELQPVGDTFVQSCNDGYSPVYREGKDFFDYSDWYKAHMLCATCLDIF